MNPFTLRLADRKRRKLERRAAMRAGELGHALWPFAVSDPFTSRAVCQLCGQAVYVNVRQARPLVVEGGPVKDRCHPG